MKKFLTNRERAASVEAVIARALGYSVTTSTGRVLALLDAHPNFWCNESEAGQLRNKLSVVTYRLTGEANSAVTLAERIMRDQAGLPTREDDTDPVFERYASSEGLAFADAGQGYSVVGACPVSSFRWAVVMSDADSSLKLMRWSQISGPAAAGEHQAAPAGAH